MFGAFVVCWVVCCLILGFCCFWVVVAFGVWDVGDCLDFVVLGDFPGILRGVCVFLRF